MTTKIIIKHGTSYERTVLRAIATAKQINTELIGTEDSEPIEIHARDILIRGFNPCVLYLENKYPYPNLLFGEPESQAAMLMLLNELKEPAQEKYTPLIDLIDQAKDANPFMLGTQLSLVDIAASPYWKVMPANYQQTLTKALHLRS